MNKKAIKFCVVTLIACLLMSTYALPRGYAEAATDSYNKAFVSEIQEKYEIIEKKYITQYYSDLDAETAYYEQFLQTVSAEQKKLAQWLAEDLDYLVELLEEDYNKLNKKYGDQSSYKSKLRQYKNAISPDYLRSAMWKYKQETNVNSPSSWHYKFNNQISPNRNGSLMSKYRSEINADSPLSEIYKYSSQLNTVNSRTIMGKLKHESNINAPTSTMYSYVKGNITLEEASESMDSILTSGENELQSIRQSVMGNIKSLREDTVNALVKLRDEAVRNIIKQRTDSIKELSDLREQLFGSGIKAKTLTINLVTIQVVIDGELQQFEQSPVVVNGTTLVPMRAIFETLGAKVEWNQAERSVKATKGDTVITLKIGSNIAVKNGQNVKLDVPAQTISNYTMVPLRFISESLGASVMWNGKTNTVTITTK